MFPFVRNGKKNLKTKNWPFVPTLCKWSFTKRTTKILKFYMVQMQAKKVSLCKLLYNIGHGGAFHCQVEHHVRVDIHGIYYIVKNGNQI